jgi:hypothetical protein
MVAAGGAAEELSESSSGATTVIVAEERRRITAKCVPFPFVMLMRAVPPLGSQSSSDLPPAAPESLRTPSATSICVNGWSLIEAVTGGMKLSFCDPFVRKMVLPAGCPPTARCRALRKLN